MTKQELTSKIDLKKARGYSVIIGSSVSTDKFGKVTRGDWKKVAINTGDFLRIGRAARILGSAFGYNYTGEPKEIDKITAKDLIEDLSQKGFKDIIEALHIADEVKAALGIAVQPSNTAE